MKLSFSNQFQENKYIYIFTKFYTLIFDYFLNFRFKTDVVYSGGMNIFPTVENNKYPFFLQSVGKLNAAVTLLFMIVFYNSWN